MTALLVVSLYSNYQIGTAETQLTNTSSVSELIEKGDSFYDLGRYDKAIAWYDKVSAKFFSFFICFAYSKR